MAFGKVVRLKDSRVWNAVRFPSGKYLLLAQGRGRHVVLVPHADRTLERVRLREPVRLPIAMPEAQTLLRGLREHALTCTGLAKGQTQTLRLKLHYIAATASKIWVSLP